jgi:pimeloyl-ACP methyl ester carboxylesterase
MARALEAVALSAGRLRFTRAGEGPDLVLLHGLLGSGDQWAAAVARWARTFTCWSLELPGISRSDDYPTASLSGLRQWLEEAVNALGLSTFSLAGASWGGAVALVFACAAPTAPRLRRLLLAAPAHPLWRPSLRQRWMMTAPLAAAAAWLGARLPEAVHRELLAATFGNPRRLDPALVPAYSDVLRRPGLGRAVTAYCRRWPQQQAELRAQLPACRVPTLLIWGDRDPVVPATTAPALQQALPASRLVILPGLGHLAFAEDPDAFVAAAAGFLN